MLHGNPGQVVVQATAIGAVIVYSGVVSFILLKLINVVLPLRADAADEDAGLDTTMHGEDAYNYGE
jgi:Amt family ammonium transporter